MHSKFLLLLMLAVHAGAWAQTPFTNFIKKYVETKGVEVEQESPKNSSVAGDATVIYAYLKKVTVDDEYPKILKAFRRNLETFLDKNYTLVSFTKDADNEDINKMYKFIKDSTVEMLHYQKEEDQVTLHVFELVFKDKKEEELKRMPLNINMNQPSGAQPMRFHFSPAQNGNESFPKTDSTKQGGHELF